MDFLLVYTTLKFSGIIDLAPVADQIKFKHLIMLLERNHQWSQRHEWITFIECQEQS